MSYPQMLPSRTYEGATGSEKWVFDQIASDSELDGWTVLHSLGLARHQRKSYAECDFVAVGPLGVYCLEVKGGHVRRESGLWVIGWPGAQYTSAEGPFKQAQSARGALLEVARQRMGSGLLRRVPFGWGVVFPDIPFGVADPEWDLDCVYDAEDARRPFAAYLRRLAKYTCLHEAERGRHFPERVSRQDTEELIRNFRPDFDRVPAIGGLVRESRSEMLSLTPEQYGALDIVMHESNPRVLCEGAAGTGKTVLACEAARRHASRGRRVLLLCFNRNLAWNLRRSAFAEASRITVDTAWRFLAGIVRKSDVNCANFGDFDDERLAQSVENAMLDLIDRELFTPYDVLVVDEAQDVLTPGFMKAIDWVLEGGLGHGRWNLFLDSEVQADIYGKLDNKLRGRLSALGVNVPLTINMRNPRRIAREAAMYAGTQPPICRRAFDAAVDYRPIGHRGDVHRTAQSLLTELMKAGAKPSDIALLSVRAPEEAFFAKGFGGIGIRIQILDGSQSQVDQDEFYAASVSSFKGLESEIVIVGDLPDPPLSIWYRASLYVALTRARTAAYVLAPPAMLKSRLAAFDKD